MSMRPNSTLRRSVTGLALASALVASAIVPAGAAPFAPVPVAGPSQGAPVEQVRCNGCWIAGGVAAGVLAGAAIANANRSAYYYNEPPPAYYAPPPRYAPAYSYGPRKCWVEVNPNRQTGYWTNC